jgi:transcriptional regulator with XRE-family HTH domain
MVALSQIKVVKRGWKSMWTQVGERVGKLRRERNLSRAQFGKIAGLSEQHVGKIERGVHGISGTAIAKICNATGVSSDFILFGITDPTSTAAELSGLSQEQIEIGLDMLKRLAKLIHTDNGNHALLQEVLLQQHGYIELTQ